MAVPGRGVTVIQYMRENFRSDVSIAEIARNLTMSESQLRAEVMRQHGQPPLQFLTRLRMGHALELLQKGKYTIQEVAEKVGIPSRARFRRTFQRYFGFAPTRFKPEIEPRENPTVEEGIACFVYDRPVPVTAHPDHQLDLIWRGRLDKCSAAYAKVLGWNKPSDVIGIRLDEVVTVKDPHTIERHYAFIRNKYAARDTVAHRTRLGVRVPIRISITGVVRDGAMVESWGSVILLDAE